MSSAKTLKSPAQGEWTPFHLFSSSNSYLVEKIVGQGTFGTVAKCKRSSDQKTVAIKIMKDTAENCYQTRVEAENLQRLSTLNSDTCNIVQWHSTFVDRGYFCLVFESLDKSLLDLMIERKFQPLLLKEIRPIVKQLSNALFHLREINMIHADLKLENVMLVNHAHEPLKIKVIDFGLACNSSSAVVGSCIQTLAYRCPEVILGLPFTEAVDMWSVGCIAACLFLGSLLYTGNSEYDIMRCIVETQGQLSDNQLSQGLKTGTFFENVSKHSNKWKLKSPEEVLNRTGEPSVDSRAFKLKSLDELLCARKISSCNHVDRAAEVTDLKKFVEMLKRMLHLEGSMRLTPHQALHHPFIRMGHLRCKFSSTSYFKSSINTMAVCRSSFSAAVNASATKPVPQNRPAMGGCPQQPVSGTANPDPKCHPASLSAVVNNNRDQQNIYPHPCTVIQSTCNVKSGTKRKADNGDLNLTETTRQSKFAKHKHSLQSCEEKVAVSPNDTPVSFNSGGCPQQAGSGSVYPVPQYWPALGGCPQQPPSRTTTAVLHYWPAVGGFQQQPPYGATVPVKQYWPAVGGFQQQPPYGATVTSQQYWPAVGGFQQQPPYGATVTSQQYWPAVGGFQQQPPYGGTVTSQQYWPAVGGFQQQPPYGATVTFQQHRPAVGGFQQQHLYGTTTTVQPYSTSSLPAAAFNLDQQHINPQPHT